MKFVAAAFVLVSATAAQAQGLLNGSFEEPTVPSGLSALFPTVPGWRTTDVFEILIDGAVGFRAYDGVQFVELNSNQRSTITQNSSFGSRNALMGLSWAHQGRSGTDTARLDITTASGSSIASRTFSSPTRSWTVYRQAFVKSDDTLSYSFTAVSQADLRNNYGNFIDGVKLVQLVDPGSDALLASKNFDRHSRTLELSGLRDCGVFDTNGTCVGTIARVGAGTDAGRGGGTLVAARRIGADVRVGAFVDTPERNNGMSGQDVDSVVPSTGAFVAYGVPGQVGFKARAVAGMIKEKFNFSNTEVYMGGQSAMTSSRIAGRVGYGFQVTDMVTLEPYATLAHMNSHQNGYTRNALEGGWAPITASKMERNTDTAGAGLDLGVRWSEVWQSYFGVSVDHDLRRSHTVASLSSADFGTIDTAVTPLRDKTRLGLSTALVYSPERTTSIGLGVTAQTERSKSLGAMFSLSVLKGF